MEKEYEEFVEKLRTAVISVMGMQENQVFFRRKGEPPADTGDRLFVECTREEDARHICGIYTEELFQRYEEDETLEELAKEVAFEIRRVKKMDFLENTKKLTDYNQVKKLLFIRLLNVEVHKQDLRKAIYRTVGDIALVLYMKVSDQNNMIVSMKIRDEYIERWGLDWETVFDDALLNTLFLSPPRIFQWEKLLYNQEYGGERFMDSLSDVQISRDSRGNCLSTAKKTNGAVAIFLPGVAKRLGEMMGRDLYLAFTSIHEVMVHNADRVDPEELERVLAETIREATPKEDFLSGHIFYYNRRTETFTCL